MYLPPQERRRAASSGHRRGPAQNLPNRTAAGLSVCCRSFACFRGRPEDDEAISHVSHQNGRLIQEYEINARTNVSLDEASHRLHAYPV